jgi:hypothetical protein
MREIKKFKMEERANTHFQIYITDKFYYCCNPKVASSWAYKMFGKGEYKGLEHRDSFDIATMQLNRRNDIDYIKDELVQELYRDWESLLNGKSCRKDWVFVIRNPIEKMITGYIQDVFLKQTNREALDNPIFLKHIKSIGYNKAEIDAFIHYYEVTADNRFPNVQSFGTNNEFMPMYYDIVKSMVDMWAEDTTRVINEINYDHKESNLMFILKLLTFPPNGFDSSKIRVIDIDRQNLGATLKNLYGLQNIDTSKQHARELGFKFLVFKSFKEHFPLIYSMLAHEALIYVEIINKLYPHEMYKLNINEHKTIPPYVYTAEEFLEFNSISSDLLYTIKKEPFSLKRFQDYILSRIDNFKDLQNGQRYIQENGGRLRNVLLNAKRKNKNASSKASKYMVGNFKGKFL